MNRLLEVCKNLEKNLSKLMPKRIDGQYIGSAQTLINKLAFIAKDNWKMFVVGEITKNTIIKEYEAEDDRNQYYCEIKEGEKKDIIDILNKSYIRIIYLFDESYNLKIIVDNFPKAISIDIDLLH